MIQGGYVEIHRGAWRVHGVLSVSRSIGDAHLKDWVMAEPDTMILQLTPDTEFLVLASDGLWEEVSLEHFAEGFMHIPQCLIFNSNYILIYLGIDLCSTLLTLLFDIMA